MKRAPLIALLAVGLFVAVVRDRMRLGGQKRRRERRGRLGDETISKEQFDELLDRARENYAKNKQDFPAAGTPQYVALRSQAMQFLVQRAQFEQKAEELGLEITESRRRQADADDQVSVLRQGRQVRRRVREEVRSRDQEAGRHERAGPGRRARERRPEQDLREGDGGRHGFGQGRRGLLQEEQAELRPAGEPRRAPHPRQEEGGGGQPLPAA